MTTTGFVFGEELSHLRATDAARASDRRFVRGRNELGVFDAARKPTGHVLTAWEAYHAYGLEILEEAVEYGSAIINHPVGMDKAISKRTGELGLPPAGSHSFLSDAHVVDLEKIGFALGLDALQLGHQPIGAADTSLAVRLRTLGSKPAGPARLSASAVRAFAHAASVIRAQCRLQGWLGIESMATQFEKSQDYGTQLSPAYKVGFDLAQRAREKLGLGMNPIASMRRLVEDKLGIPVLQIKLPESISGATIAVGDTTHGEARGIVLNTVGDNSNVWVRRSTLAHELGHLLFDPIQELDHVRVDTYNSSSGDPETPATDAVEQRANAFAIAFLAPKERVEDLTPTPVQANAVAKVMMTFGISHTAARYHIRNAHYRQYDVPRASATRPSDEQKAAENFATDYFSIPSIPDLCVGRFMGIVAACYTKGFISDDSAAQYLGCSKEEVQDGANDIIELYELQ